MTSKGWHYRGYLPHFDQAGVIQHLTLSCLGAAFADSEAKDIALEALRHFDGERYDLLAWCVMPDHLHVLVIVLQGHTTGTIVTGWKRHITREINRLRRSSGALFQADYFDRFARSARQVQTMVWYIENNPVKAGLCTYPEDWTWSSAGARGLGWEPCVARVPVWLDGKAR